MRLVESGWVSRSGEDYYDVGRSLLGGCRCCVLPLNGTRQVARRSRQAVGRSLTGRPRRATQSSRWYDYVWVALEDSTARRVWRMNRARVMI